MIDSRRCVWRAFPILVLWGALGAGRLAAQGQRDSLIAKASEEFDTGRQLQLLRAALDPGLGPPSGSWASGVQLLAQTLLQDKRDSLAAAWLRWAVRVSPSLQPDTVRFLPFVATALRSAQDFVQRSGSADDSLAQTSWVWPAQSAEEQTGKLQVSAPGVTAPLRVATGGGVDVTPGAAALLDPGSYQIHAAADGYDSLTITREVLPAVTTVIQLRPRSFLANRPGVQRGPKPQPAEPTMPPIEVAQEHKKKFPWLIVGLGAVGAGVAVAALAGGGGNGDGGDNKGGITVTFPNP
jgi:hypothetical protein